MARKSAVRFIIHFQAWCKWSCVHTHMYFHTLNWEWWVRSGNFTAYLPTRLMLSEAATFMGTEVLALQAMGRSETEASPRVVSGPLMQSDSPWRVHLWQPCDRRRHHPCTWISIYAWKHQTTWNRLCQHVKASIHLKRNLGTLRVWEEPERMVKSPHHPWILRIQP